uniref:Uncharacterized protein n=1 Tax=Desertifilum tharense IPPAS B-1220 TaxID=1781255 RepID=A0ACD5GYK5_9CYAN
MYSTRCYIEANASPPPHPPPHSALSTQHSALFPPIPPSPHPLPHSALSTFHSALLYVYRSNRIATNSDNR